MAFELATAGRIVFGAGRLSELGPAAAELGRRALVVTGASAGATRRAGPLLDTLHAAGVVAVGCSAVGEPTLDDARRGVGIAREAGCDLAIGFGGGSAIDLAKAVAGLLGNGGDPLDYVEVIGRGQPLTRPAVPWLAVPTTAGAGAEVTRNAVLRSPEERVKVSLRSPHLLARVALVDPALTVELPPEVTAATGLDALTQLLEAFVSVRANPFTDGLCREGLSRAGHSLRRAWSAGHDLSAREDMALASLFSGLALANAGLGAVHGFAAPLGGSFAAPHGAVCAALLAPVMRTNLRVCLARGAKATVRRYDEVAGLLTGDPQATAQHGIEWVEQLVADLRVPPVSAYGIGPDDAALLVERASAASSMKANPVALTPDDLHEILVAAGVG